MFGNLTQVALPSGDVIEYLADPEDRRIQKKVNGVVERAWLYRDQLRPTAEFDGNGNVVSRFVYALGRNVPDYMIKGGKTYRLVTDNVGSVRLMVDVPTGAVAQRTDYDEFGIVLLDTNPGFQPFGFAGGLYDPDTGVVRFGARDYDAHTGRWTEKDPILFDGGDSNLYAYVGGDPINFVDIRGHLTKKCYTCLNDVYDKVYEHCVKHECISSQQCQNPHGKSCHDACDDIAAKVAVKTCKAIGAC